MLNEDWPAWLAASVAKHFDAIKGDCTLILEGDELPDRDSLTEWAELRILGPRVIFLSHNCQKITVDINILINVRAKGNIYRPHALGGRFLNACTDIKIKNYLSVAEGNETVQFCLTSLRGISEHAVWSFLGKATDEINLLQGVVSARYEVLTNEE